MKRCTSIAVIALVLALVLLSGCSDDFDRANAAMDRANKAVDQANEIDKEVSRLVDELAVLQADDKAQAKTALGKLDEAEAKLAEKHKKTQASIDALEPLEKMDISADYKTYVKQQISIARLQQKSDALGGDMFTTLRKMYTAGAEGTLDQPKLDEIGKELDAIFSEGEAIDAQIISESQASEAFFKEKGLE